MQEPDILNGWSSIRQLCIATVNGRAKKWVKNPEQILSESLHLFARCRPKAEYLPIVLSRMQFISRFVDQPVNFSGAFEEGNREPQRI